jgi:homotetrameric cytidine deaminase
LAPRRNVELKARDPQPAESLRAALAHGAEDHGVLAQRDTYFDAREGRLKLREETLPDGASRATLIAYRRADEAAARTSAYRLTDIPDPATFTASLQDALGITVVVAKRRRLLLWEDVRIHLDEVEGLGAWIELEAVAPPESDLVAEHAKVAEMREVLGMADAHVVAAGYAQLLLAGGALDRLVAAARQAMDRAYVPYSHFPVGAALRDEQGRVHAAPNVENAAYPQGQCAEASAIGVLVAAGGARVQEVAVMAHAELITPCGGCRQRLSEFAGADVLVHLCGPEGVRRTTTLGELLPLAFDHEDLDA